VTRVLAALVVLLAAQTQPSGTISGRVTEQGSGQPLPRIVVTLVSADRTPIEEVTDADGRYRFLRPEAREICLRP
jgi:5-hydroxyisourate hydrolase-like protein (transthyretin family)